MVNETRYAELETLILSINHEKSYLSRLKKELSFIKLKGTAKFFLLAFEITNDLKQKGVIIGPANGFSNNSLINYLLGFTTINPTKYDLICEPYFNLNYSFLSINVSNEKAVSRKHFGLLKETNFEINEMSILKEYQENSTKINFNFYPQKLKKYKLNLDFRDEDHCVLPKWEIERKAMLIDNENDLINSFAFANYGLKGFHISKMLKNKHIPF